MCARFYFHIWPEIMVENYRVQPEKKSSNFISESCGLGVASPQFIEQNNENFPKCPLQSKNQSKNYIYFILFIHKKVHLHYSCIYQININILNSVLPENSVFKGQDCNSCGRYGGYMWNHLFGCRKVRAYFFYQMFTRSFIGMVLKMRWTFIISSNFVI